jgi:hypothetical protein
MVFRTFIKNTFEFLAEAILHNVILRKETILTKVFMDFLSSSNKGFDSTLKQITTISFHVLSS